MSTAMIKVLNKMCKMVGADPNQVNFRDENYQKKYTWTFKQQRKFKEWLRLFMRHGYNRKQLMRFPNSLAQNINNFVDWFTADYGWEVRDEK